MNLGVGEGLIFEIVSWSECSSSCIECDLQKTWIPMNEVVRVFIAFNHFLAIGKGCWRWAHRTATVHCPMRATSAQPLGFGAVDRWRRLSSSCIGQSGATPNSPVPSDFCALTSVVALFTSDISKVDRWRVGSCCSAGSPDSPVAHQTVRWHTRQSG
jgi:hypothetical protein